ncbi:MAG: fructose-1,6-bisphosphatase [Prevotellaceae bacterium]|nr:fructose-1,6-bisphosphatase [Prevotellaceae bacterium]
MPNKRYNLKRDKRYLELLAQSFPTVAEASTEIINLQAILNLPKGTEHFLADIHGEHQAFLHVLKNASGNIKRKVNELYGSELTLNQKREFCSLIYYPEEKLEIIKAKGEDTHAWYIDTIQRLVTLCREVSSKYTRSKVRKSLPVDFSYIIQELLHENTDRPSKKTYVNVIIETIISTGRADDFIIAISNVIQRLIIDELHILGDVYDRGPGAHIIMDTLRQYHSWDIQWGNHDVLWMGACVGNTACICNVIRLSLRYANLSTLEDGYGINMMPLATFAMETYGDDPCEEFMPRVIGKKGDDQKMTRLTAQMHKAISVLQFKAEAEIIKRHPHWKMDDRCMLNLVDYEKGTITIDGKEYALKSNHFPTVDPANPSAFTEEELLLIKRLRHSFKMSEKLAKHMRSMLRHGSMYAVCNGNLLYHAAIPLNEDGTLREVEVVSGHTFSGRELLDAIDILIRTAFQQDADQEDKQYAKDYFMYLWCGPESPLFNKSKMATFERYFIDDHDVHHEDKGYYFKMRDDEEVADRILDAFGVTGDARHIINGHVPVHAAEGENPIKANGKLMVIDGGFSQPYHKTTGIAGYTLVYHSRGFQLVQHAPFTSAAEAIMNGTDIKSTTQIVEMSAHRMLVGDTDRGSELKQQVVDLKELLYAYRHGWVKEQE